MKYSLWPAGPQNANQQSETKPAFFSKTNAGSIQAKKDDAFFQAKLTVGQPGDKYEQEADAMADAVVNKSHTNSAVQQKGGNQIQRVTLASPKEDEALGTAEQRVEEDKMVQNQPEEKQEEVVAKMEEEQQEEGIAKMEEEKQEEGVAMKEEDEKEETPGVMPKEEDELQKKATTNSSQGQASTKLTTQIGQQRGRGKALPQNTQTEMEGAFGADFSNVNIHTDNKAVQMTKEAGAQAFATGSDIYFNEGKFKPETSSGKHLLAHELTHVVQQGSAGKKNNKK